jgi:hypothetical protein
VNTKVEMYAKVVRPISREALLEPIELDKFYKVIDFSYSMIDHTPMVSLEGVRLQPDYAGVSVDKLLIWVFETKNSVLYITRLFFKTDVDEYNNVICVPIKHHIGLLSIPIHLN